MENVNLEFVKEDGDRKIRDSNGATIMCDMQYYPWNDANDSYWRLWAAAPELLQAVKFAKTVITDQVSRFHNDCRCQLCESLPMMIDAAIDKAEGRS